jgi:K+-sensing histidine kinase KdpD
MNRISLRELLRLPSPPRWLRYGIALLMVLIGTALVGALMVLVSLPVFGLYIITIVATVIFAGIGPGLLAAALALFVSHYVFIPPHFSMASERSVLPLVVLYFAAVVVSTWVASRLRF